MNKDRRLFLSLACAGAAAFATLAAPMALADQRDLSVESTAPWWSGSKPKPTRPAAASRIEASLFALGPSRIAIGTPIRFQARSNLSGYGHVYIVNTSGSVVLLAENLRLKANVPVDLPRAGLTIRASAPTGSNEVIFLATREPLAGFGGGQSVTSPVELQMPGTTLQQELKARLAGAPAQNWSFSRLKIRVTR